MSNPPNPSSKKQTKKIPKNKSRARKTAGAIGRVVLTVFLIFIITCTLVGGSLALYVINFVTPQDIDLSSANLDSTTFIYANNKNNKPVVSAQISGEQNRIWVTIDQIPQNLQNAFVCTEDQRFYEHEGVDWKRTVGSFANLFFHFYSSQSGGSTITQQLVNNLEKLGKNKNDYGRKVQEIVDALALEKKYDNKSVILEAYLNTISLNEGCYGVETAAQNYFGKDVKNLDLAQCAALACLPKAPSTYDPRNHPDKNAERRKIILKNMLDQNKITQQEYDKALKEKVTTIPKKTVSTRGWFEDMVITDVQNDLVKKYGWDSQYALNQIYTKGLKIYTTESIDVQAAMDKVYTDSKNEDYWYQYEGTTQPQSAMMITDYTGKILGVEGGRGQKSGNMVYNRATDERALRPPGSSLKPLGVYAPAIELNKLTWSSLISCTQIKVPGNPNPWPANDEENFYTGTMSLSDALARSINTVAVHIDQDYLSPQYTFDFLTKKLGFTTLNAKKDVNAGIAIGAVSGVTVKEMAGAYEIFGNNGLYTKPYSYTKVVDNQGNVLLENKPVATQAISADTSFVMNKLLQNNVTSSIGTGQHAAISGLVVGGKTGTTNDHKDRWFCGITPDYVGVVWFGYDTPKDVPHYDWTNPAVKAWTAVMEIADKDPKKTDFPSNGDVVQERYDPATGYITSTGSAVGWFKEKGILPTAPVSPAAQ